MLTVAQKTFVQDTFASITPIADDAAVLFYQRLFEIDPGSSCRCSKAPPSKRRSPRNGSAAPWRRRRRARVTRYSALSATSGSTRVARQAGIRLAATASSASNKDAPAKVTVSVGRTS